MDDGAKPTATATVATATGPESNLALDGMLCFEMI